MKEIQGAVSRVRMRVIGHVIETAMDDMPLRDVDDLLDKVERRVKDCRATVRERLRRAGEHVD
jgi:hypothetical protein